MAALVRKGLIGATVARVATAYSSGVREPGKANIVGKANVVGANAAAVAGVAIAA